jgi:hypothetical protein
MQSNPGAQHTGHPLSAQCAQWGEAQHRGVFCLAGLEVFCGDLFQKRTRILQQSNAPGHGAYGASAHLPQNGQYLLAETITVKVG